MRRRSTLAGLTAANARLSVAGEDALVNSCLLLVRVYCSNLSQSHSRGLMACAFLELVGVSDFGPERRTLLCIDVLDDTPDTALRCALGREFKMKM